jgi:hypothetical protein
MVTDTYYVDCQPLADKTVAHLKSLFQYWFDMAAYHRPTVIVLDNLDKLLPAEQEVGLFVILVMFTVSDRCLASTILPLKTACSAVPHGVRKARARYTYRLSWYRHNCYYSICKHYAH